MYNFNGDVDSDGGRAVKRKQQERSKADKREREKEEKKSALNCQS